MKFEKIYAIQFKQKTTNERFNNKLQTKIVRHMANSRVILQICAHMHFIKKASH